MFRILTVCTGNVCRSPLAAQLLRHRLDVRRFEVGSAGVRALVGTPMPREAAAESRRYGGDPSAHRAVQLTAPLVARADLVLTAEVRHRADVLDLFPSAVARTFTLRQFARLAAQLGDDELAMLSPAAVIVAVAAQRGIRSPMRSDDDIADPYRGSAEQYSIAARLIDGAVAQVHRAFSLSTL